MGFFLVVTVAGCSLPQIQGDTVIKNPELGAKVKALKQENSQLRALQTEMVTKLSKMMRRFEKDKVDQKRFQNMMATNFDLLEQSIALSLKQKTGPVVAKNMAPAPPKPNVSFAPDPEKTNLAPHEKTNKTDPGEGLKPALAKFQAPLNQQRGHMGGPLKNGGQNDFKGNHFKGEEQEAEIAAYAPPSQIPEKGNDAFKGRDLKPDPDLTPPVSPRELKPHRQAKALYNKGFKFLAKKKYAQAVMVYEDFLNRFPGDIYSDNAQFWVGEAYFKQNKLDEAEKAYRKVLKNYEHKSTLEGYKTPDAIYRIGLTYLKREMTKKAGEYFKDVATRFPETSAGKKAKRELEGLMRETA